MDYSRIVGSMVEMREDMLGCVCDGGTCMCMVEGVSGGPKSQ